MGRGPQQQYVHGGDSAASRVVVPVVDLLLRSWACRCLNNLVNGSPLVPKKAVPLARMAARLIPLLIPRAAVLWLPCESTPASVVLGTSVPCTSPSFQQPSYVLYLLPTVIAAVPWCLITLLVSTCVRVVPCVLCLVSRRVPRAGVSLCLSSLLCPPLSHLSLLTPAHGMPLSSHSVFLLIEPTWTAPWSMVGGICRDHRSSSISPTIRNHSKGHSRSVFHNALIVNTRLRIKFILNPCMPHTQRIPIHVKRFTERSCCFKNFFACHESISCY